jgi:tetratricopeptide (TPR) repeat protein
MSVGTSQQSKSKTRQAAASGKRSFNVALAGTALLAVVIFAIYWPSLHGTVLLDDDDMLRRWGETPWNQIWFSTVLPDYWPVTASMIHIEWGLWGTHTLGYHVVNVLLHLSASVMLWRILKRLAIPGAFVAALLFTVHPVNVESVAWMVQRKNTLSMFWFLASIYCYVRMEQAAPGRKKQFYWLSLVTFLLALLSKIAVVILPPLLVLITWWQRPFTKRDILRVVPFFALAAILSLLNIWFMAHANPEGIRTATWAERIVGAGAVTWFYLWKALLPLDLAFIYPNWKINLNNWLWFVPLIGAFVATAALWLARKTPIGRALFVGWLFFCIALLPVMGFSDTGFMKFSLVADHYQHVAIIAVVTLVAAALARIPKRNLHIAVVAIIAGVLSVKAARQATIYHDAIALYRAAIEKNPTSWMLHGNLADELLHAGQVEPAIAEFRETLRLNPQSDDARFFYGEALLQTGDVNNAVTQFNEVIKIPRERYHFKAYHRLAMVSLARGDKQQALALEEKSQEIVRRFGIDAMVAQSEQWLHENGLK